MNVYLISLSSVNGSWFMQSKNTFNTQRPHQGIDNQIPKPRESEPGTGKVVCNERLGGLINSYERLVA